VGVVLALPVAIEALRQLRSASPARPRDVLASAVATIAPVAGGASYLAWVGRTFGDPLLPFTIQQSGSFRGALTDPVRALWHPAVELVRGDVTIDSIRLLWAAAIVGLLVVVWRRWPASYAAFATALAWIALSTTRLGSFERYAFTAFPVLLALATISARPVVDRLLLAAGSSLLGLYGFLALLGAYVP
jgi:hypothetical protein